MLALHFQAKHTQKTAVWQRRLPDEIELLKYTYYPRYVPKL